MKLKAFRVLNYKCIDDSGEIVVGDLTCFVGVNESGKSSLLEALQKFNAHTTRIDFKQEDFPRHRGNEFTPDTVCIEVLFELADGELNGCNEREIRIAKTYENKFVIKSPSLELGKDDISKLHDLSASVESITLSGDDKEQQFKKDLSTILNTLAGKKGNLDTTSIQKQLDTLLTTEVRKKAADNAQLTIKDILSKIEAMKNLEKEIPFKIPTIAYFDEYDVIEGKFSAKDFLEKKKAGPLTREFRTISNLLASAKLDIDALQKLDRDKDSEVIKIILTNASTTITTLVDPYWGSKEYRVNFERNLDTITIRVKDEASKEADLPLNVRSRGIKWNFSFNINFNALIKGELRNVILLLDEPGLYLHPGAQGKHIDFLRGTLASNNQLLYTTHSPFLMPLDEINDIRVVTLEDNGNGNKNTKVHNNWRDCVDENSLFPFQSILGVKLSNFIPFGKYNLIVEGISDIQYLHAFNNILDDADKLSEDISLLQAFGVDKIPYLVYLCIRHIQNVRILLDNDGQAVGVRRKLLDSNVVEEVQIIQVSDRKGCTIEDLIDRSTYLKIVREIYPQATIKDDGEAPILEVLKKSFKNRIDEIKKAVADKLAERLPTLKNSLGSTQQNFKVLISKINSSLRSAKNISSLA